MENAELTRGMIDRESIIDRLGGIQVPSTQVGGIKWEHISTDCLPVFLYRTKTPKALIAANRFQLDTLRQIDQDCLKEVYIVEIARLMKHSNLTYCEDTIEKDRKFRHKKTRVMFNEKKAMMKDIITQLNRNRTAGDIAAAYKVSAFHVNQLAVKLRKPPYNFNIPTLRGFDEFNVFAEEIAKENPEFIKKPLAPRQTKSPAVALIDKIPVTKGHTGNGSHS